MNPKESSFLQQHIEKLILGVALLAALLVAAYFLILSPFVVEINRKPVGPEQALDLVEDEADRLRSNFKSNEIPEEKTQVPDWGDYFVNRIESPTSDRLELAAVFHWPGLAPEHIDTQPIDDGEIIYHLPDVPVVGNLQVRTGHAVYRSSGDAPFDQAVFEFIGDQTPRDFRYVSVSGQLDLDDWTQRLLNPTGNREPIPSRLWRDRMAIAGVFLQRQTLDPATGQWSETTIVPTMPDQIAFGRPNIAPTPYTPELVSDHLNLIATNQPTIAQIPFFENIGGLPWTPPGADDFNLSEEQQTRFNEIQREVSDLNRQIRQRARRLGLDREQVDQNAPPPNANPNATARPTREPNERQKQLRQQAMEQYQSLIAQRDALLAEKNILLGIESQNALGRDMPDQVTQSWIMERDMAEVQNRVIRRPQPVVPPTGRRGAAPQPEQPVEQPRQLVDVWAHDLTVEPGKTYRYRLIATLVNPLFQIRGISDEQMKQNINRIAIGPGMTELDASDWSQPIAIAPSSYFFLVGGNTNEKQARFSVWTIFDGMWRNAEFNHRPGDPIGGPASITIRESDVPVDVDLSAGYYLVDVLDDGRRLTEALCSSPTSGQLSTVIYTDPEENEALLDLKATSEIEQSFAN